MATERKFSLKELSPFKKHETVTALSSRVVSEVVEEAPTDTLIAEIESIDNPLIRLERIVPLYDELPDDASTTLNPLIDSTSHDTLEWLRRLDEEASETHYGVALGSVGVTACLRAWETYPTEETEQLALTAATHVSDKDLQTTYERTIRLMKQEGISFDDALATVNRETLLSDTDSHKYEYPWLYDEDAPEPQEKLRRTL